MAAWNPGPPKQREDSISQTEFLTCVICEELYDDNNRQAKFLSCYHTFCFNCLTELYKRQDNPGAIPCPNCRHHTQLLENGVIGLQSNFYVDKIKEITNKPEKQEMNSCHKHSNQPRSFFCDTCKITICRDCTVLDHSIIAGHVIMDVTNVEVSHRRALTQQMNEQRISLAQIQSNMTKLDQEITLLTITKKKTREGIEKCICNAHEKVEEWKQELIKINDQTLHEVQNFLLSIRKPLQETTDMINKNLDQCERIVKDGSINEVIYINQLMNTTRKMQCDSPEFYSGKTCISFDPNKGTEAFENTLSHLANIDFKGFHPAKFELKCKKTRAGQRSEMQVKLFDDQNKPIPCLFKDFKVEIIDPSGTKLISGQNTTGSEYIVTFIPQMSGPHTVSAMFKGQQLTNEQNQISMRSNDPVLKFGQSGYGYGTFQCPLGIAIDNNDCLYVVDTATRLIQKFTASGAFLSELSVAIHNNDIAILDIALDLKKGFLYCVEVLHDNQYSKRILVFDLMGKLRHIYTLYNIVGANFIAINNQDELIISDKGKNCLSKFDITGNFLCHIGNLKSPGYIAITEDDSIIVPDMDDHCVYIFNPDGQVKHRFGTSGKGKGQLVGPLGIATDGEYILVGEESNNRIQVFKNDGSFVSIIESSGDPLHAPHGLAVTTDGHVYVADRDNHCIKMYKYREVP